MYKVVKREIVDAPTISHDDIMSMTEASDILGIAVSNVGSLLNSGRLTTVIDQTSQTAFGNFRRLLLRAEVLELKKEREEVKGKEMPAGVALAI